MMQHRHIRNFLGNTGNTANQAVVIKCPLQYIFINLEKHFAAGSILNSDSKSTVNMSTAPAGNSSKEAQRVAFFRTIESAGDDWKEVAQASDDIFLQKPYLQSVELHPPEGMRFGYLVFYQNEAPVGIALCQIKHFSVADSLSEDATTEKEPCFFNGLASWFKRRVAGWAEANILVCGNLLVTGEHGFYFLPKAFEGQQQSRILMDGLEMASQQFDQNGVKIASILIKDIAPDAAVNADFKKEKYTSFQVQPNMVLSLDYQDFGDYLGAMTTKYRTRAKRAFKKGTELEMRELSTQDVAQHSAEIFALYKDVAHSAGFNMVDLNETYLLGLQKGMEGDFRVFGWYLQGHLVSFCTTLKNGKEMEAHFIGYSKSENHEYQIYLNMLYHMVGIAFESGCEKIVFSRTALEIKSSIGAVPEQLDCFLKHRNGLMNKLAPTLLDYFTPVEEWQQRHPFKHHQPDGEAEA